MSRPKVISLFSGAGGLDLGLEAAGFETAVALEFDPDAVATLRRNRDWSIIEQDIHEVSSARIQAAAGVSEGEADLLVGGPPCQPFSKSGYWAAGDSKRLDDPRASTLEAYLRVLRDLKPKAFLLENVSGLAYRNKSEGFDLLRRTIDSINAELGTRYHVQSAVVSAAAYGTPQERERILLVGQREGAWFEFPHGNFRLPPESATQQDLGILQFERPRTAWDAIGDLEEDDDPELQPRGKWADLLPSIPEGRNYLYHTDRGEGWPLFGWRRRYWSFLLKLAKRLPSWTITAQPGPAIGPFHWKNRRLSMRELCRLQTFPDDICVVGSRQSYQRQIGNAVPCVLAEAIGRQIRRQLLRQDVPAECTLVPKIRTPVPPPEPVEPVPEKYRVLVGKHSAHPGTGQGYAALARQGS